MTNKATQPLTTDADVLENLDDIEHMAVELATLAGAEIVTTYGGIFTVRYKTGAAGALSSRLKAMPLASNRWQACPGSPMFTTSLVLW